MRNTKPRCSTCADGLGSVRQIYNASAVVGSTRYDPYGNVMAQRGATSVLAFAGEQYDSATGLKYLRARYYFAYGYHPLQGLSAVFSYLSRMKFFQFGIPCADNMLVRALTGRLSQQAGVDFQEAEELASQLGPGFTEEEIEILRSAISRSEQKYPGIKFWRGETVTADFGSGTNGNITLFDPFFEKATPERQRVATLLEENFHSIQNITVFGPGTADLAETEPKQPVDEALRRIYGR